MPNKIEYKVVWDNGNACDSFPQRFPTRKAAEQFAREWKRGMVADDPNPAEARRAYSWEVVPV